MYEEEVVFPSPRYGAIQYTEAVALIKELADLVERVQDTSYTRVA